MSIPWWAIIIGAIVVVGAFLAVLSEVESLTDRVENLEVQVSELMEEKEELWEHVGDE